MGNCSKENEFYEHYKFVINEELRVLKPGRLVSIHCGNIPAIKERDGYIGIKDFRGELIKMHVEAGFIFHSEVCVWKDPLIEATRTKSKGLMYKQIQKDSSCCRMGLPDYVITFKKPGENKELIQHNNFIEYYGSKYKELIQKAKNSIDVKTKKWTYNQKLGHLIWREYASPIWMDIRQTNTLNVKLARDNKDERHICPLQLDTIARHLILYTNPNDLVLSWFAGIGSEGYQSLKMNRRFIGMELKNSYFDIAVQNLNSLDKNSYGIKKIINEINS